MQLGWQGWRFRGAAARGLPQVVPQSKPRNRTRKAPKKVRGVRMPVKGRRVSFGEARETRDVTRRFNRAGLGGRGRSKNCWGVGEGGEGCLWECA